MKRSLACLLLALGMGVCPVLAQLSPRERMKQDEVSQADVNRMVAAAEAVKPFLDRMWQETVPFPVLFRSPRLEAFYETRPHTPCGEVAVENAEYCQENNTIYYDPIFLAKISKSIGKAAGTLQSYGGIAIIEHELGHAIGSRREVMKQGMSKLLDSKYGAPRTYERERYADCLMGALTARAHQLGVLPEHGEVEARLTAAAGGDWESFGNDHGDAIQRANNFNDGYRDGHGGIEFCSFISRDAVRSDLVRGAK